MILSFCVDQGHRRRARWLFFPDLAVFGGERPSNVRGGERLSRRDKMAGRNIAYAEWLNPSHCPNGTIKRADRRLRPRQIEINFSGGGGSRFRVQS